MFSSVQATEQFQIQHVRELSLTKHEIFNSSKLWVAENFRSSNDVIQLADIESGSIVGNGLVGIPFKISFLPSITSDVRFKFKIDIKENKYRITYHSMIMLANDTRGYDVPIEEGHKKMRKNAQIEFTSITDGLHNYLVGSKNDDDW
jgi:hypothetical protein